MKWAPIKATRNPTNAEAIRWGHLAKLRVYQMEMERHYGEESDTDFSNMAATDSVPDEHEQGRQR